MFILFILKKNKDFYLYINYCVLNKIIIKNRHILLLIDKTLNYMMKMQKFLKIDLKDVYHYLHIKKDYK